MFDFSKIFFDYIFSNSEDFLFTYANLPSSSKDQLMDLLSIWLDNFEDDISLEVIIVIKNNFFINSAIEHITSSVVNILVKASIIDRFNSEIRTHTKLLKKVIGTIFQ